MPFNTLSLEDQRVLLGRLAAKKLARASIQAPEDLIVKARTEVVLSGDGPSALKPVVRRPASLEEMRSWLGHPAGALARSDVKRIHAARVKGIEKAIKSSALSNVRTRAPKTLLQAIAGNPAQQAAFRAAAHAAVEGIMDVSKNKPLYKAITALVSAVSVFNWAFVNVTVKAGGTLVFNPPGPHTLVAHTLTVEPGGRIVANRCQLTLDCQNMVIQ